MNRYFVIVFADVEIKVYVAFDADWTDEKGEAVAKAMGGKFSYCDAE